jgi:hypothetical protein
VSDFLRYLPVLACVFALLSGLMGLIRPTRVLDFVALEAKNPMGILEIRAMCFPSAEVGHSGDLS